MSRTISSAQTFFLKFLLAPLSIGLFTVGTAALFRSTATDHGRPIDPHARWIFLAVTSVAVSVTVWTCARLKRVSMTDTDLQISNYRREIAVPLYDLDKVTQSFGNGGHPITLRFRKETEFGHAVVFIPKVLWPALFSPHPIVDELREAAARARLSTK